MAAHPAANAPMAFPWLGFVDPMVLPSPTAIPLAGPPALDSTEYATDFAEVRDFGGTVSMRSPEQTATAPFYNAPAVLQYQIAMHDQVTGAAWTSSRPPGRSPSSTASIGDAVIACWRAKYDFNFWRPVTAIALADTDGNPATDTCPAGGRHS